MSNAFTRVYGPPPSVGFKVPRKPATFVRDRAPLITDKYNYNLGDFWIYKQTDPNQPLNQLWVLVALAYNASSNTDEATWIELGTSLGNVETLTGNDMVAVDPDVALNINVVGDNANNINITGNNTTHTLTAAVSGTTDHAVQIGNASGSLTSLTVGTNGQVLLGSTGANPVFATLTSSDGSISFTTGAGTLSLQVAAKPAFSASNSGNTANLTGDGTVALVINDVEVFDILNNYNPVTGIFTAPTAGVYHFSGNGDITNLAAGNTIAYIALSINGGGGAFGQVVNGGAVMCASGFNMNAANLTVDATFNLAANDTVQLAIFADGGAKVVGYGGGNGVSNFSGFKV